MVETIKQKIIPEKLMTSNNFYRIKLTDNKYIIKEFEVYTNEKTKKIEKLTITKGKHPNCDQKTKDFCIPDFLKEKEFNSESLDFIINMLKIFNFKSSYIRPWFSFEIIQK